MKYKILLPLLVSALFLAAYSYAQNEPKPEPIEAKPESATIKPIPEKPPLLKTESEKLSYAFGSQFSQGMKAQGVEINIDLFIRGFKDVLDQNPLALTLQQQRQVITAFQSRTREKQLAKQKEQTLKMQQDAPKNLEVGKAFLDLNGKKTGITTTASGLQYRVIKEGTGKIPEAKNTVKTHYRGTLIDGTEFDSSYKRNQPSTFPVLGVIKGWTEALQLMKVGAKWELFIPSDLAYGPQGRPSIPANSALIFEIELLEIMP